MTLDDRGARAATVLRRDLDGVTVPDPPDLDDHPTHHRRAVTALALFVLVMLVAIPLVVRDRSRTDGQEGSFAGDPVPTDATTPPAPAVEPPVELLVTPPNGVPYAVYVDDPALVTQTFDLYLPESTISAFITDAPTDEAVGWLCSLDPCDPRETDTTVNGYARTWWAIAEGAENESIVSVHGAGWTFVAQGPVRDLEQFTSTLTITSGTKLSIAAEGPLQVSADGLPNGQGRLAFVTDAPEPAVIEVVDDCRIDDTYTCFGPVGARAIQGDAADAYLRQPTIDSPAQASLVAREEVLGGLTVELIVPPTIRSGDAFPTTLRVENLSGQAVTVRDCRLSHGTRYGLVPVSEPDAELLFSTMVDCGGPVTYEPGVREESTGPNIPTTDGSGAPLEPGDYLAAWEVDGERLHYPVTVLAP